MLLALAPKRFVFPSKRVTRVVSAQCRGLFFAVAAVVQNRCYAKTSWDAEMRALCKEHNISYQAFCVVPCQWHLLEVGASFLLVFVFCRGFCCCGVCGEHGCGLTPLIPKQTNAVQDATMKQISERHNVTVAQSIYRFLQQVRARGTSSSLLRQYTVRTHM